MQTTFCIVGSKRQRTAASLLASNKLLHVQPLFWSGHSFLPDQVFVVLNHRRNLTSGCLPPAAPTASSVSARTRECRIGHQARRHTSFSFLEAICLWSSWRCGHRFMNMNKGVVEMRERCDTGHLDSRRAQRGVLRYQSSDRPSAPSFHDYALRSTDLRPIARTFEGSWKLTMLLS